MIFANRVDPEGQTYGQLHWCSIFNTVEIWPLIKQVSTIKDLGRSVFGWRVCVCKKNLNSGRLHLSVDIVFHNYLAG